MATNLHANISINVGAPSNDTTVVGLNIYNDHGRTQMISQEISGSTGVNPTNGQVWVFSEGQNANDFKEKIEELGFFGSPQTYGSGSGAWACVDLQALKETGAPIPPLDEMPFVQNPLPGNSHIEFKLSSSTSFSEAVQAVESEQIPAPVAFFNSFSATLGVHGDGQTLDAALQMVEPIVGQKKITGLRALCHSLTDATVSLTFAGYEQLPEDAREKLKKGSTKKLLKEEIAGIIAGVGDLFEQNFRIVFVLSESIHVEIQVRGPGIVEYAMSAMDN